MKPTKFKILRTGEIVICDNIREVQIIEEIEYLTVRRINNSRTFLMRKEALVRVEQSK
jgi:hypothetical protein